MLKKDKLLLLLGLCLTMIPVIVIGVAIAKYSVNFVYWDEWFVAEVVIKAFQGKLTFADLIKQHNESRYLFPRLIFIALAYLTRWDIRAEMAVSFLLACIVSINLYKLNALTLGGNISKRIAILFLTNLLIFAPIQNENWVWGIQMIVFVPITCITTCLVVIYSTLNLRVKFIICALLSTISTFSYANGILCWIVVFPVLALSKSWKLSELIRQKWLAVGWVTGLTANIIIYFYDYKKHLQNQNFLEAIVQPQKGLSYFLSFLGAPFGWGFLRIGNERGLLAFSILLGLILILLFLGTWLYFLKFFKKDSVLTYRMLGFLMIGSYTVISAAVTTLGRIPFGVEQSLATKYATFSLYLPIALINLLPIIIDDAVKKEAIAKSKKLIYIGSIFLASVMIFLHWYSSVHAIKYGMAMSRVERIQGKSCLLFINVAPEEECLQNKVLPYQLLYPYNISVLKDKANDLNKLGLLQPRLIGSKKIKDIQGIEQTFPDTYGYGWLDSIAKKNGNVYSASGWARLPHKKAPADAVILTYENSEGEDIIFALSYAMQERPDVVKITKENAYRMSGWQNQFKSNRLPKGLVQIKAWAFDIDSGKAFKLNNSQFLDNS